MRKLTFVFLALLIGVANAQSYKYPDLGGVQPKVRASIEELRDGTFRAATLSGAFQQTDASASGYSYNLVSLTNPGSSASLRGWRVNLTSADDSTVTDMQCLHGYLTLGSGATVAAGGAHYPLSAWIDVPSDVTFAGAAVVAGVRAIFDANTNALGSAAGGVESALFYGQTWASAGTIDSGLFMAAGAGSTIDAAFELGSGTFGRIMDFTSWGADTPLPLIVGGPKDASATAHFAVYVGDQTSSAAVASEVGAATTGSLYISTTGKLYQLRSGTWVNFDSASSD
jgi:hypothetical protein